MFKLDGTSRRYNGLKRRRKKKKNGKKKKERKKRKEKQEKGKELFGFYGISTIVGYLMPNPFLYK